VLAPPTSRPARGAFRPLTVTRVDPLCADAAAITFDVPSDLAEEFTFRPGQSLTIRRVIDGRDERRSYSICARQGAAPRIGVREVSDGAISGWLVHEVRPGDDVEVSAPSGRFTPDLSRPAQHVFIAAGSGITPVLSIAASVLVDPASTATIVYGNRRADSVMFADEVADLKDSYPTRLQLVHVLSREAQEVELFSGRLTTDKLRSLMPVICRVEAIDEWWLCGPYGLVTGAIEVLTEFGVEPNRIHRELFYVEDVPPPPAEHPDAVPTGAVSEVTVVLDGRTTTTTVPRDTPILDGAQRVRPDLPFACKGGVCGTCRAQLVAGEVNLRRNFALEQSELSAGFVLTCQSLPVSAAVTVDYDR
jgi:ring-1,2-phenylacetyl-CoA epoxidase subunit PaaE